ncbi:MAG TPA: hypothetical protein VF885_12120 [Arthrobacter sp.]
MATDAMTPEQEINRADEARFLMENPLLRGALDDIEAATIQKWEMADNKDVRDDYWRLYKVAKLFRQIMETYIATGKMARMTLIDAERQPKRRSA